MPELPEVQSTVDSLRAAGIVSESIRGVEVGWPRTVGGDTASFSEAVHRRRISDLQRRGKFMVFELELDAPEPAARSRSWATCHLRMSGRLHLVDATEPREGYERLVLKFHSGRELRFVDPRKFGRFLICADPVAVLATLGPEPLSEDFSPSVLAGALAGRRRALKPTLLDQSVIAGLGNIYVDEALFCARLHPLRRADSLTSGELAALHAAIQSVLRQGLANLGVSLGNGRNNFRLPNGATGENRELLRVFRRTGLPCPVCGTVIERIVVAQRSTHFCRRCQILPPEEHNSRTTSY